MLNEIKDRANDKMQKALNNLNESLGGLRACLLYTSRCV